MALPIIFSDRDAFNAAVGDTTLLTFDTVPSETQNPLGGGFGRRVTFDDLLEFRSDSTFGHDSIPGVFCFCNSAFDAEALTLRPVMAFGLDLTPLIPDARVHVGDLSFTLTQPQFLGVLYSEPTTFTMGNALTPLIGGGLQWSTFTIDNVAMKSVPEPSSLWLMALSVFGLYGGRKALTSFSTSVG
jgi:hypothetical protein